eukprot:2482996-Lingulodinium_polyedra.AAC.1
MRSRVLRRARACFETDANAFAPRAANACGVNERVRACGARERVSRLMRNAAAAAGRAMQLSL